MLQAYLTGVIREVMGGVRPEEWVFGLFIIMRNFCH